MSQDCNRKLEMLITSDEKLKKLAENPELLRDTIEKIALIADNALLSADARREALTNALNAGFTESRFIAARRADDELKKTAAVKDWLDGIGKIYKNPKEAVLSMFERGAGKVVNLKTYADAITEQLNNSLADNILSRGLMEFAKKGTFDTEISDVIFSGKKHVGDNAEIINTLASIYEHNNSEMVDALNSSGALIKKRDGHLLTQLHNGSLMYKAGYEQWKSFIYSRIDVAKTFGDMNPKEQEKYLKSLFDRSVKTIPDIDHMSVDTFLQEAKRAQSGAGVATAERTRQIHFKTGKDAFEYHQTFGKQGTLFDAYYSRNKSAAKSASVLKHLGHSPEENLKSSIRTFLQYSGAQISQGEKISIEQNAVEALEIFTGKRDMIVDPKLASIGTVARSTTALAQLGRAVTASVLYDPIAMAMQRSMNTGESLFFTAPKAFMENMGGLLSRIGDTEANRIQLAKKIAVSLDKMEELSYMMMSVDKDQNMPGWTRTALNGLYRYTGADYANKVARITGVMATIEDMRGIASGEVTGEFATRFKQRYRISDADLSAMQAVDFDATKMDKDIRNKFSQITNASFDAASPGVDNRFKRQLQGATMPGSLTGEIMRTLGQYKGASYRQMLDFGEMMRVAAPDYGVHEGVGVIRHAIPNLAAVAVWGTTAGIMRAYSNHLLAGKPSEEFDMFSPKVIKNAIQSSGSMGGMMSDLVVPFAAYLKGDVSKAALYQHIADFAAPAGSFGFNAVETAKSMTDNLLDGDGFFASEKQQQRFYRLLPYQNVWYADLIKNYLIDASLQ